MNEAMSCGGVHTFFIRFPIDVVFVARDGRVVKVRPAVKPWRLALAACETRAGDRLERLPSPGTAAADRCTPSA
jgi:uncharacterized membrane protein (UPF0127 family)